MSCRSLCLNRRASSRPGLFSSETVSPKGNSLTSWPKRSEKRILRVPFVCEKLSFYQARLGTNIGQVLKRTTVRAGHRVTPGVQAPRLVLHATVRTNKKRIFCAILCTPLNMIIILPRQALDNHRERALIERRAIGLVDIFFLRCRLTFIIVQKRHHTRFFAMNRQDSDRSGNPLRESLALSNTCIEHL